MSGGPDTVSDTDVRDAIEGRKPATDRPKTEPSPEPSGGSPAAGPHADPSLINPDATPGTGALTPPGGHDDMDSTSG